jgi:DNA sulfur modification protein DndC
MLFLDNLVNNTKEKMKEEFLKDNRPWVVTFSGGKDSTTVLHLTIDMLLELPKEKRKKVFIVASDTLVEMPIITDYFYNKINQIKNFIKKENLNIEVKILKPEIEESFWTLLLGRGYPAPGTSFRWCTDRLKIRPATKYLTSLSNKYKSIIMLLGVRKAESTTRKKSIEKRELNFRGLTKHDNIPNAYIFSPIKEWSNEEVWTFLANNEAPWGTHKDMMKLYDKGSGEADCNIALNPDAPSCGKTRFGCWVCTVVNKDKSMENMLTTESWMKPLNEFRNLIVEYKNNPSKRNKRRRTGEKRLGPYTLEVRRELFEKLIKIENAIQDKLQGKKLILDEEILEIQKEWEKDGDFLNSAIEVVNKYGRNIYYSSFNSLEKEEKEICFKNDLTSNFINKILEIEYNAKGLVRRNIYKDLDNIVTSYAKGKIDDN